jgi:hypothetical protein
MLPQSRIPRSPQRPPRPRPPHAPHPRPRRHPRALDIAATLALLVPVAGASAGPGFTYPGFAGAPGVSTRGAAALIDGSLRLTPAAPQLVGAAWHSGKVPVAAGFTSSFTFRASQMGGSVDASGHVGADGFAFVIQPVSDQAEALDPGGRGGNLGYATLSRAVAVEFDTWFNAPASAYEPDGHHVALVTGGLTPINRVTDTLAVASLPSNIADGLLHDITVDYADATLRVFVDGDPALSAPIDIAAAIGLDDGLAYVGFTAATGGGWQNHDIWRWEFASVPAPGAPATLALGALALARRRRPA